MPCCGFLVWWRKEKVESERPPPMMSGPSALHPRLKACMEGIGQCLTSAPRYAVSCPGATKGKVASICSSCWSCCSHDDDMDEQGESREPTRCAVLCAKVAACRQSIFTTCCACCEGAVRESREVDGDEAQVRHSGIGGCCVKIQETCSALRTHIAACCHRLPCCRRKLPESAADEAEQQSTSCCLACREKMSLCCGRLRCCGDKVKSCWTGMMSSCGQCCSRRRDDDGVTDPSFHCKPGEACGRCISSCRASVKARCHAFKAGLLRCLSACWCCGRKASSEDCYEELPGDSGEVDEPPARP